VGTWENIKQAKGNELISTKVLLQFFPPVVENKTP
jgi:hypothetical protein